MSSRSSFSFLLAVNEKYRGRIELVCVIETLKAGGMFDLSLYDLADLLRKDCTVFIHLSFQVEKIKGVGETFWYLGI